MFRRYGVRPPAEFRDMHDADTDRNRLCYERWQRDGWSRPQIREEVNRLAMERDWGAIETDPGVSHAIQRYADPRGLLIRRGEPGRRPPGKK
jgi:hypothetical protein